MCARNANPVSDSFIEAVVDALWRQWHVVGGPASGGPPKRQVDPEILCLASLALKEDEPRLWDTMADWIRVGASLISVQRLKNLAADFEGLDEALASLAGVAVSVAKDARWRSISKAAAPGAKSPPAARRAMTAEPALTAPQSLVLRLRAAFAVGVKADLIAFLLGQEYRVSVAVATAGLGYSTSTVFRALQDLDRAGFVRRADQPSAMEYWIERLPWEHVLGRQSLVPFWGYWRETLSYACAVVALSRRHAGRAPSEYARGTALRTLGEAHESGLARAGIVGHRALRLPESAALADWQAFHSDFAAMLAER
jgi:hypothetical protein